MVGYQGRLLPVGVAVLIVLASGVHYVNAETEEIEKESKAEKGSGFLTNVDLHSPEFQKWLQEQEGIAVEKIMEKISSPNDTEIQRDAKLAVAKYLVKATFIAVASRLEVLKLGKKQSFLPSSAALPASAIPGQALNQSSLPASPTAGAVEVQLTSTYATVTTTPKPVSTDPPFVFRGSEPVSTNATPAALPSSSLGIPGYPVSSSLTEQIEAESGMNATTTKKPIWEEILTFNFSAALQGGNNGMGLLSRLGGGGGNGEMGPGGLLGRLNLSALRGGGEGGPSGLLGGLNLTSLTGGGGNGGGLLGRLNITGLGSGGGEGGLLARLNLTSLGSGGEGGPGSLLARLNLTGLGGGSEGGPGGLLARLNLTGGEGGASKLLARLNISLGNSEGGPGSILSRFNFSSFGGDGMGSGGIFSRFNLTSLTSPKMASNSSTNETKPGLPFGIPATPEILNIPTPPPKNDSVRMSQMYLGNQIEKLMGNVNNSNLTGIVESSINIATPNTVGVLVNALLNIVLCNPIDRFNGNCGIE